eukprot:CAMPEP_0114265794 /NCGR_PEP_ID=MMETSP0058-20121206/24170_1 /TAXON_ID=36894 /ORGANISM="Pyramimonas parkeae, CCMP726" /LENGTH=99 /DNA_ID=CAMNT_0001383039 /DNA_START=107 /DNA_END=406 /DNA_ORIENTATION=-
MVSLELFGATRHEACDVAFSVYGEGKKSQCTAIFIEHNFLPVFQEDLCVHSNIKRSEDGFVYLVAALLDSWCNEFMIFHFPTGCSEWGECGGDCLEDSE